MNAPLNIKANIVAELQERLAAAIDGDVDFLAEELIASAEDFEKHCAAALRGAKVAEGMAEGIKPLIEDMRERKARLERKAELIRAAVAHAMQEAGLPKITAPDMTVSFRNNKPTVVTVIEAKDAPEEFVRTKVEFRFDNDAIRTALEAGRSLDWATLNNQPPSLTIKSK